MKDIRTKSENTTPRQRRHGYRKKPCISCGCKEKKSPTSRLRTKPMRNRMEIILNPPIQAKRLPMLYRALAKALPKWLYIKAVSWPRNAPSNGTPNKA